MKKAINLTKRLVLGYFHAMAKNYEVLYPSGMVPRRF